MFFQVVVFLLILDFHVCVSMIQSIEVSSDIAEVSVGSIADVIYVFSPNQFGHLWCILGILPS